MASHHIEKVASAFAEIRQVMDQLVVGHGELKDALVVALFKRALGIRGGHVLVYGPPGTGKTHTVKSLVSLLEGMGVQTPYERVQGNPDLTPSDFLFRRTVEYEGGSPRFVWALQKIGSFVAREDAALPGIFQFDELDKTTPSAQFALLEVMEEQQITVLDGRTLPLNFVLVATANTRRFDPTAKPLSRAVQDRFGSVVILGYQGIEEDVEILERAARSLRGPELHLSPFPIAELMELRREVQERGLPLRVSEDMKRRIVAAVKLTQQAVDGFPDFTRYIKAPAGPRAILDLYWESTVSALLDGAGELTADYPLAVGLRVLRGRVEVTPEAEIGGVTTDVLISQILAAVFGPSTGRCHSSCELSCQQDGEGKASSPDASKEGKGQPSSQSSEENSPIGQKDKYNPKGDNSEESNQTERRPAQNARAQGRDRQGARQERTESRPDRSQAGSSRSSEAQFLARLRQASQGPQTRPGGTRPSARPGEAGSSSSRNEGRGGSSEHPARGGGSSPDREESPASSGGRGEEPESGPRSGASGGGEAGKGPPEDDAQEGVKAIVSRQALAQWLARHAAGERFRTAEGIKTGAEIARDLAAGKQRFDFEAEDGAFKASVRGERAICQGDPREIQGVLRHEENADGLGRVTTGGSLAGKGTDFPTLDVSAVPPHIAGVLPLLRGLSQEQVVEKLEEWIRLPPGRRSRVGIEYRLIKGFVHLSALQAVRNAEETEGSELTASPSGERVDFVTGSHSFLPLDEERTIINALEHGGLIDDLSLVHEKRVCSDAPDILLVLDASGSMEFANRMLSAAVAAAAVAQKYGPLGGALGLIVFTSNPALVVPMPGADADRVVDAILSVQPGGGTSYAKALELAFWHAAPKTTVVVIGDFLDNSLPAQEAIALKAAKEIKVIGIVSSAGNPGYARRICDEAYLVAVEDPTSVALVAIEASA
jgi:MoxR-like ATPase